MFEPIPGIPRESWRTRARYQLFAAGLLASFLVALLVVDLWRAPAAALRAEPPISIEGARQAYERGDYVAAHAALRAAALQGNAEAQELLGLMYALGERVYPGVLANARAASLWLNRAALNGRPTARYLNCALSRRDDYRGAPAYCFERIATSAG